jgi:hypothetical protein
MRNGQSGRRPLAPRHVEGSERQSTRPRQVQDGGSVSDPLHDTMAQYEQLKIQIADALARVDVLERELANERELCQAIEDAAQDESSVQTLERVITRHSVLMQEERQRMEAAINHKEKAAGADLRSDGKYAHADSNVRANCLSEGM